MREGETGRVQSILERSLGFASGDAAAVAATLRGTVPAKAGTTFARQGRRTRRIALILSGMTCKSQLSSTGMRQISAIDLPNGFADLSPLMLPHRTFDVVAIGDALLAEFDAESLRRVVDGSATLTRSVWELAAAESARLESAIFRIGRLNAAARLAHLTCEIIDRRRRDGDQSGCLPAGLTQTHLADATGLTPVHVNRALAVLVADGALARRAAPLRVGDWSRLARIGEYRPGPAAAWRDVQDGEPVDLPAREVRATPRRLADPMTGARAGSL